MGENGYNTANFQKQGGDRWVVSGTLQVTSGGTLGVAGAVEVQSGASFAVESGGALDIESGGAFKIAATQVTPSAAELNVLDGAPMGVVFTPTVASTSASTIGLAIQLNDAGGAALAVRGTLWYYLSGDVNGDTLISTKPAGIVVGTDGVITVLTQSTRSFLATSESDGDLDINVQRSATAAKYYLVAVLPNGKQIVSTGFRFD